MKSIENSPKSLMKSGIPLRVPVIEEAMKSAESPNTFRRNDFQLIDNNAIKAPATSDFINDILLLILDLYAIDSYIKKDYLLNFLLKESFFIH